MGKLRSEKASMGEETRGESVKNSWRPHAYFKGKGLRQGKEESRREKREFTTAGESHESSIILEGCGLSLSKGGKKEFRGNRSRKESLMKETPGGEICIKRWKGKEAGSDVGPENFTARKGGGGTTPMSRKWKIEPKQQQAHEKRNVKCRPWHERIVIYRGPGDRRGPGKKTGPPCPAGSRRIPLPARGEKGDLSILRNKKG